MSNEHVQSLKLQDYIDRAKVEIKKALTLAKSMVLAGQTNTELKDTLSELGLAFYQQQKNTSSFEPSQDIKNLISKVNYLEKLIESHESDIKKVKLREK